MKVDTMPNYFYVNRGLLQSNRWLNEPFTRGQAWVDLFGLAQHKDSHYRVRGIKVDVKRGQLSYSQVTLAKRWKWSRGKVIRYLNELEKYGDIVQQKNEITTIITILKYDLWQANGQQTVQQTDSKRYTYKKDKKDKNDKKKRGALEKPTLLEVKNYIEEKDYAVNPQTFFDYFTESNWVDSRGNKVKNWKQKIITWHNHEKGEKNEEGGAAEWLRKKQLQKG